MPIIWQRSSFQKNNRSKGGVSISNLEILIIIVISLICVCISYISSKVNKNKEKIDKGLVFAYHKLTYRRKMIRTLWIAPVLIGCLLFIYKVEVLSTNVNFYFTIICCVGYVGQFFYNFYKWRQYEQHVLDGEL